MPYAYPDNDLSYAGNFLNMMFKATEVKYVPNKTLEHALDVLFILHADHEQNASTSAMRGVGSTQSDQYSAMAAAAAAAIAEYGSDCVDPTPRIALVDAFCSWSA